MLLNILLTLLIIVAVSLTGIILLQRSEGGALGMGGGSGQFMSARGASDLLTQTTQVLGGLFFVLALAITILTGRTAGSGSVVDRVGVDALDPSLLKTPPAAPAPGFQAPLPTTQGPGAVPVLPGLDAPAAPAPTGGSLFGTETAPAKK